MCDSDNIGNSSETLEIRLLGRFEVLRDGEPIPERAWGRRKTKALLKVLLTYPNTVFTHDQLIETLFPSDSPAKARSNLYSRVSRLRHALEPELTRGTDSRYVLRQGEGYSFNTGSSVQVDVLEFQTRLRSAQAHADRSDWAAAILAFEGALALYRGEFIPEDSYESWDEDVYRHFRKIHIEALMSLAE